MGAWGLLTRYRKRPVSIDGRKSFTRQSHSGQNALKKSARALAREQRRAALQEQGHVDGSIRLFLKRGSDGASRVWRGGAWHEFIELFRDAFDFDDEIKLIPGDFRLKHSVYGVLYTGFELDDLYDGAIVELVWPSRYKEKLHQHHEEQDEILPDGPLTGERSDFAHVMRYQAHAEEDKAGGGSDCSSHGGEGRDDEVRATGSDVGEARGDRGPLEPSLSDMIISRARERFADADKRKDRRWAWQKKLWEFTEDPLSSFFALIWMGFIILVIIFGTITFILESLPFFYEAIRLAFMHTVQATVEEGEESEWASMEAAAIAVFSLEIALRLVSCENIFDYFFPKRQGRRRANLMNWIDVVAVIPFYIGIAISNEDAVPGLQVLRVLRLVRVFRLFRVSKTSIAVFGRTMRSSAQPMSMLIFFLVMGLVVFSSLIYYCERGVYDEDLTLWKRTIGFQCLISVDETESGTRIDDAYLAREGPSCVIHERLSETSAVLDCLVEYKVIGQDLGSDCLAVSVPSPFTSIPEAFWWTIVTMTTVGYGDMFPVQWYGKLVASFVMIFGLLVLALPISVIGSAFSREYHEVVLAREADAVDETELMHAIEAESNALQKAVHSQHEEQLRKARIEAMTDMLERKRAKLAR